MRWQSNSEVLPDRVATLVAILANALTIQVEMRLGHVGQGIEEMAVLSHEPLK